VDSQSRKGYDGDDEEEEERRRRKEKLRPEGRRYRQASTRDVLVRL
jgi:hypothetical protein